MPIAPQVPNVPIDISYNSTDYDADSVQDVQLTTTFAQTTQPDAIAVGDVWFDTANGNKMYSWDGTSWTSRQDAGIAAAGSKNKNYYQTTAPTGGTYTDGDLWFDTDDNNKMYRYSGGNWTTAVQLGGNALANVSATTITTGTLDANVVNVSNINAGNITTGTLTSIQINNGSGTFKVTAAGALTATSADISGKITSSSGTVGGFNIGSTYLSSGVGGTGFYINSSSGNAKFNNMTTDGYVYAATGLTLATGTCTVSAGANDFNNVGGIFAKTLSASSTIDATGQISANGELYASQAVSATVSAATNCYITTGGLFRKTTNTSSIRYKENVTDINNVPGLDPKALLQIPIRAFSYKTSYLPGPDDRSGVMLPGFIAEEVDAVYPVAVDYDGGNIEAWNSQYIIPGLLALIQDLYKRIEILESKI